MLNSVTMKCSTCMAEYGLGMSTPGNPVDEGKNKRWRLVLVSCYCKYFEIFKSCRFTLDHLLILIQPSRLSSCALRSCRAFLLSGPLWKKRWRLKTLRLSLPVRLSGIMRRSCGIVGLLCSLIRLETRRPNVLWATTLRRRRTKKATHSPVHFLRDRMLRFGYIICTYDSAGITHGAYGQSLQITCLLVIYRITLCYTYPVGVCII